VDQHCGKIVVGKMAGYEAKYRRHYRVDIRIMGG
jgi:hypothetical protein